MLLEPIYEHDFYGGSYGFRPGRSAHQALQAVWEATMGVFGGCDGLRLRTENDRLRTPWSPNALPQVHPCSWYALVCIDHFSRRIMGSEIFEQNPTAAQIESAMKRICKASGVKPKYLISDQGSQFISSEFRTWCKSTDIKQRFGAIGKHGSIAVTE